MHCNKLPVRSFKCVAELTVHEVSAPGARLAQKDDLYLNVCLLGQQRRTRLVQPLFPLKFADHLIFEKVRIKTLYDQKINQPLIKSTFL